MKIQRTFCFAATVLITQLAVAKTALLGQLAQVEQLGIAVLITRRNARVQRRALHSSSSTPSSMRSSSTRRRCRFKR